MFRVFLYYQLTEFLSYIGDGPGAREQQQRTIGSYIWNRRIPGNPFALQVYLDVDGERLEETLEYPFDHLKDCSQDREAENR